LEGSGIVAEVDSRSSLTVYLRTADGTKRPLTATSSTAPPTDAVVLEGAHVSDFQRTEARQVRTKSALGMGKRLIVQARSVSQPLLRTLTLDAPDAHPGVLLVRTTYTSTSGTLHPSAFIENAFEVQPLDPPSSGPAFWSFQGVARRWGEDYVLPVLDGFSRRNAAPLYGGVPYCDLYSRGGGLGVGSAEVAPKTLALPVTGRSQTATVALEWPGRDLPPHVPVLAGASLVIAHTGDFYSGLRAYARAIAALGVAPPKSYPPSTYLQHWETWGYEQRFTAQEILQHLDDLTAMGIGVVTIDYGWFERTSTGTYAINPQIFPNGDADVRALTDAIHAHGLKAKLWWQPGLASPTSQVVADHPDWFARAPDGKFAMAPNAADPARDVAFCPLVPEALEYHRQFVRKALQDWGFDGFKMDTIWGGPACYAPNHHHTPEEALAAYPRFLQVVADTARAIKPDAMLEVCNCGTAQNLYIYPFENEPITADPVGGRQVRVRLKALKAFFGPTAPVLADHVELTTEHRRRRGQPAILPDFASCFAAGGVLETKYTEFASPAEHDFYSFWLKLGKETNLAAGEYLGDLYSYGFDTPETHVVRKGNVLYYGFFVEPQGTVYQGKVELRGLGHRAYRLEDYVHGKTLGTVQGPTAILQNVTFTDNLLLRAVPLG
jgi:hypothetical protein